jgi:hypothetical protein
MLWITDTFRIRCVLVLDTVTTLKLITLIYIIFLNYYQCRRVNRIENSTGCSSLVYINNLNKIMFCSFKLDLYLHWSFKKKKFSQIAHLCYILFTLLTFFSYSPFTMLFFMLYFVNVWTITFIPQLEMNNIWSDHSSRFTLDMNLFIVLSSGVQTIVAECRHYYENLNTLVLEFLD